MAGPTPEQRLAYQVARSTLDGIEAQRANLVKHTDDAYHAAMAALEDAEEACEPVGHCEACGLPIFAGDKMLSGEDPLCAECAPTFADLLNTVELSSFVQLTDDGDWEPMTSERARSIYDAHIGAGGFPGDSMATEVSL